MEISTQIIIFVLMIIVSAFFSLAETTLISLGRFKVRHWVEKKKAGAVYVKKLKDNPETLLSIVLIGNNLVNTAAAVIMTSISLEIFDDNVLAIATGIATLIILVFGDIIPKSIGTASNERLAPILAPIIWYLGYAVYHVVKGLDFLLKAINRIIGSKVPVITEEELKTILKTSEEEGAIKEIEKKLIHRIFDFDSISVADVMTRKGGMVCVSSEMAISDVLRLPTAKMYTRFPVYAKTKDNIIGILNIKDMLKSVRENKLDAKVGSMMGKPLFAYEGKKLDAMLKTFQAGKQHMAIVVNDKNAVVGLITIENILEEIVGEIIDESDRINPSITEISKNAWVIKGSTEISEVNSKTGIKIKESDFISMDSFVFGKLKRAPRMGEVIVHGNYRIIMEDVQGKKAGRV